MEIRNATVSNASVGIDDRDRLSAMLTLETQKNFTRLWIVLTPMGVERLKRLLEYTNSSDVEHLNKKIVRAMFHNGQLFGIAHPTEGKFVCLCGENFSEVSEEQIIKLILA